MFSNGEKSDIMRSYDHITKSNKAFCEFSREEIIKASRGMYIYPNLDNHETKELYDSIMKSYTKGNYPIVNDDSLTTWGNLAVEEVGLEIRDILAMSPGNKIELLNMDRNVGDYLHGLISKGTRYNPREKGLVNITYTHKHDLVGDFYYPKDRFVHKDMKWEININSLGSDLFWDRIPSGTDIYQLDPKIKVGSRGPVVRKLDVAHFPETVCHYETWWDDYMPFKYHDFLKLK